MELVSFMGWRMKSAKKIIPYDELLHVVQDVLKKYPIECRNIQIKAIQETEPHEGANWNIKGYTRSGDDNDLSSCHEKIAEEIRQLRQTYDVTK